MPLAELDFSVGTHEKRKKSIRRHPAPKSKRSFKSSPEEISYGPVDEAAELKKLWDISKTSAVFCKYDKDDIIMIVTQTLHQRLVMKLHCQLS